MATGSQISAVLSPETKALLERHVRATGIKKGYLLEQALRYHLRALESLPADVLVPPRIVLTQRSFQEVVRQIKSPGRPSKKLRALMRNRGN
jgi:uncharacterized protein (DUF1778 family)